METKKEAETFSAKTLRRLLAPAVVLLVLCLVFIAPAAAFTVDTSWYTGHESESSFTLSDANDLAGLAQLVNGGNSFSGKTVTLGADINLGNEEWTPIGKKGNPFSGTFDGSSHTVSGLSISSNTGESSEKFYGLFGYLGGTLKNLNVVGSITLNNANDGQTTTKYYVGGLVGYNGGTIQNCSAAVAVTVSGSSQISVGGLVGYYSGGINSVVSESSATGDVTTTSASTSTDSHTGGLIGYVQSGTISKNYASGTVSAKNTDGSKDVYAGGIVGYLAGGSITECYATSQVTAETSSGKAYAGGIAGGNFVDIKDCYATGKVTATTTSGNTYAGGIVGYNNFNNNNNVISNCYALNSEISGNYKNGIAGTSLQTLDTASNYVLNVLSGTDGTNVGGKDVWNTLFGQFTTENGWKLNDAANFKLPVLKNLPAPANVDASHLFVPSITFNANGGTGTMAAQFLKEGETSITLEKNTLERVGYSFTGWNTEAGGTGTLYNDEATIENVNSDIELFAQWKINQYTLKFVDFNDENNVHCETKLDYGADITLPSNPTKPGHTFAEWYYSSEIPTKMPDNEVIIYSKWNPIKYKVNFVVNGGSEVTDQEVDYGKWVEKPTDPTRLGYTFEGWYGDEDLTEKWVFSGEGYDVVTSDTTLYANWTAWKHFITFHNYAGVEQVKELTYGSDMNLPKNTFFTNEDENKHFGGWATTEDGPVVYVDEADVSSLFTADKKETELYAVWLDTPITYCEVTFMIDGTEEYLTKQIQHGRALHVADRPANPTRAGYAFDGWYKESTLQNALGFNGDYVVNEDTKFYAKWNPIVYYVQFNNNTGTGTMVNQDFNYGVKEALSTNTFTAPSGKEFNGWNTKADGTGTSYAAGYDKSDLTTTDEATVILYAQWKSISTGNNGGTGGGGSVGGGSSAPSVKPSTPTTPTTPEVPDTPKTVTEKQEIPTGAENTVTMPTGETVFVIALDNTKVIQSVAVPEAVADANPGASVQVTEGGETPALPEGVNADDVHIVVGVSVVDKEGNPVSVKEAGYFILEADVPKGKKLVVGHYKNDIWVDCVVEALGNGQYKVNYNGLSPFAALFIDEHEESPFAAEEQPAESPVPVLGMLLGGLAAAVILRRK